MPTFSPYAPSVPNDAPLTYVVAGMTGFAIDDAGHGAVAA